MFVNKLKGSNVHASVWALVHCAWVVIVYVGLPVKYRSNVVIFVGSRKYVGSIRFFLFQN